MRLFLSSLFALLALSLFGQASMRRCHTSFGAGGLVVFIRPVWLQSAGPDARFSYDVSYNVKGDSAVLNFTEDSPRSSTVTALTMAGGTDTLTLGAPRLLYVEKSGRNTYAYRLSVTAAARDLFRLLTQEHPLTFAVWREDTVTAYTYPVRRWRKERDAFTEITELIKLQQQ